MAHLYAKNCATCSAPFETKYKTGRQGVYCKCCLTERRRKDWRENRDRIQAINRASNRKVLYGVTRDQFDALVSRQNGGCAICAATSGYRKKKTPLVVDHDHMTGIVRGLLCQPCNSAIGFFADNPELLKRAAVYLEGAKK